uniref:hypothetical protein n=1 Tax=Rhizobium mongolense TaxID=57676 RepID=UPI000B83C009|nr:hypothetical protein [Rhizobium mongolense]
MAQSSHSLTLVHLLHSFDELGDLDLPEAIGYASRRGISLNSGNRGFRNGKCGIAEVAEAAA